MFGHPAIPHFNHKNEIVTALGLGCVLSNEAYSAVYYWNLRLKKWAYASSINCGHND